MSHSCGVRLVDHRFEGFWWAGLQEISIYYHSFSFFFLFLFLIFLWRFSYICDVPPWSTRGHWQRCWHHSRSSSFCSNILLVEAMRWWHDPQFDVPNSSPSTTLVSAFRSYSAVRFRVQNPNPCGTIQNISVPHILVPGCHMLQQMVQSEIAVTVAALQMCFHLSVI